MHNCGMTESGHDLPVGLPEAITASDWEETLRPRRPTRTADTKWK